MYINPQTAIDQGWITGIANPEKQVQPNAIDFTLDRLFTINLSQPFFLSEETKSMRGGVEVQPLDGVLRLQPDSVYDGLSNISVDLPEGVAAELIIRSTLNRNGIFLTSGLYDSGYKGPIGFAIHNRSGAAEIVSGTRVGQIKFVASDSNSMYAGGYNHAAGTHWSESQPLYKFWCEYDIGLNDKTFTSIDSLVEQVNVALTKCGIEETAEVLEEAGLFGIEEVEING